VKAILFFGAILIIGLMLSASPGIFGVSRITVLKFSQNAISQEKEFLMQLDDALIERLIVEARIDYLAEHMPPLLMKALEDGYDFDQPYEYMVKLFPGATHDGYGGAEIKVKYFDKGIGRSFFEEIGIGELQDFVESVRADGVIPSSLRDEAHDEFDLAQSQNPQAFDTSVGGVTPEEYIEEYVREAAMVRKSWLDTWQQILPQAAENLFRWLAETDPTKNKQNLQWLCKRFIAEELLLEDIDKLHTTLESFEKYKKRKIITGVDINKLTTIDLFRIVAENADVFSDIVYGEEKEKYFEDGTATKLYESKRYLIVTPNTSEASCFFGNSTRWCTAQGAFHSYNEEGPLYIIYDKKAKNKLDEWTQIHFQSGQGMNFEDSPINPYPKNNWASDIYGYLKKNKELFKAFYSFAREGLGSSMIYAQKLTDREIKIILSEFKDEFTLALKGSRGYGSDAPINEELIKKAVHFEDISKGPLWQHWPRAKKDFIEFIEACDTKEDEDIIFTALSDLNEDAGQHKYINRSVPDDEREEAQKEWEKESRLADQFVVEYLQREDNIFKHRLAKDLKEMKEIKQLGTSQSRKFFRKYLNEGTTQGLGSFVARLAGVLSDEELDKIIEVNIPNKKSPAYLNLIKLIARRKTVFGEAEKFLREYISSNFHISTPSHLKDGPIKPGDVDLSKGLGLRSRELLLKNSLDVVLYDLIKSGLAEGLLVTSNLEDVSDLILKQMIKTRPNKKVINKIIYNDTFIWDEKLTRSLIRRIEEPGMVLKVLQATRDFKIDADTIEVFINKRSIFKRNSRQMSYQLFTHLLDTTKARKDLSEYVDTLLTIVDNYSNYGRGYYY
jgi:hypothetical protein